jgi:predicted DNA-binding transcriptional regulator AlpA
MPVTRNMPLGLVALPDWAVLTDQQTIELLGFSRDTLGRLDRAGDGPPRVRLSRRRHGRTIAGIREWLQRRTSLPATTTNSKISTET